MSATHRTQFLRLDLDICTFCTSTILQPQLEQRTNQAGTGDLVPVPAVERSLLLAIVSPTEASWPG